tara:strand:+ start:303 stop:464 length:162 start_codon:yes stop_codon:yes gene_type:complete
MTISDIGMILFFNLPPVFLTGFIFYLGANWVLQDGRKRELKKECNKGGCGCQN